VPPLELDLTHLSLAAPGALLHSASAQPQASKPAPAFELAEPGADMNPEARSPVAEPTRPAPDYELAQVGATLGSATQWVELELDLSHLRILEDDSGPPA
jgi:hypothetical protein